MAKPLNDKINSLKSGWYLWLFPIFALAIAGWLFAEYVNQRGPDIKITFEDGAALQAEKTRVRFRGVTIGLVKKITISDDAKEAIAHIRLQRDAKRFAVDGSKFWLVTPKVGLQGVSGLDTLVEGNYINVLPGNPDGEKQKFFKGTIGSDADESTENTVSYFLESPNVESVSVGDRVTFRGLNVGTVTKVHLSKTSQSVLVQINVINKFVKLIRTNTVFWRKVGIQAKLGLFNSEVKINALDSILHGGIDFFTPDKPGEIAKAQSKFALSPAPPKGWEKWNPVLEF